MDLWCGARRSVKFFRRSFTYGYVVTQHERDRLVELKVDRPFPMLVRYELEDAADGTLVAIHAAGWLRRRNMPL
jgi:hypothetical protein